MLSSEKSFTKYICFVFFSKVEFVLFQQRGNSSIFLVRQKLIDALPKFLRVTIVTVFDGAFEVFVCFIVYQILKGLLKLSQKLEVLRRATVSVIFPCLTELSAFRTEFFAPIRFREATDLLHWNILF